MVQKAENAHQRFEKAALSLFQEQGYHQTTVTQIALRAGLTERTFYRYFTDKQEVLFWRANDLQSTIVNSLIKAPQDQNPLMIVIEAFEAAGSFFDNHRKEVKARQALVASYQDFQERELMKSHTLTAALQAELQNRGMQAFAARMTSEAGIIIWRAALDCWSSDITEQSFSQHIRNSLKQFQQTIIGRK